MHLLPLHVAHLQSHLLQCAGYDGKRGYVPGMTVTTQHLRSHGSGLQSEMRAYILLNERRDVGVVAHRAAQFARLHTFRRLLETLQIALHRGEPQRPLQPEGGHIGVHTVRAAYHGRIAELIGAARYDIQHLVQILAEDGVRLLDEVAVGGVHHIGGGQAVMHPLPLLAQRLAHRTRESHHIVARYLLYLVNALHIKARLLTEKSHVLLGDNPQFGPRLGCKQFHLQIGLELVLLCPYTAHHSATVTVYHS